MKQIYENFRELEDIDTKGVYTFYDILLQFRTWANYKHGGVFSLLYGEGYKKAIDDALRLLAFVGLAIAEVGIIMSQGYEYFEDMLDAFRAGASDGVSDSDKIVNKRAEAYKRTYSESKFNLI